jgi:hypothetical protein
MSVKVIATTVPLLLALWLFAPEPFSARQAESTDVAFFGSYRVAGDKTDPSKLPHIGAWRINFQKSAPGAEQRWSATATNIFAAEKGGIRHSVFNIYPPTVDNYETVYTDDARAYWFKLDGKNIYPNPQGPNGREQTVAMWLIDRSTIFRERATKGVVDERVLYRVSPDGRLLTWTGFNADRDSSHTAWDRIELPSR